MLRGYIIVCVTDKLQTRCTRYLDCCTNNPEIFHSRAKLTPQNTPFYLTTSSQICLVSSQCACRLYKVFFWERERPQSAACEQPNLGQAKVVGSSNGSRAIEVEGLLFGSISNECK